MGDSEKINITIEDQGEGEGTQSVEFEKNKTIREFITYYLKNKTKSKYVSFDPKVYMFKYGAKILNNDRFIDKQIGNVLKDNCVIKLYRKFENSFTKKYLFKYL